MYEIVVKNHLVKRQILLQNETCETVRIIRSDVRSLAFGVLGVLLPCCCAGAGFVEFGTASLHNPLSFVDGEVDVLSILYFVSISLPIT